MVHAVYQAAGARKFAGSDGLTIDAQWPGDRIVSGLRRRSDQAREQQHDGKRTGGLPGELGPLAKERGPGDEDTGRRQEEAAVELVEALDFLHDIGAPAQPIDDPERNVRSGSSPISKYSPPPATAICSSDSRSSTERIIGGGRVPSGRSGSGIIPPTVRADADDVDRDVAMRARSAAPSRHRAAPRLPVGDDEERLRIAALAEQLSSFSTRCRPQRMPSSMLVSHVVRFSSAERRVVAEVIDEEEERVRILGQPDLRRRQLREQRQRHAIALPAQRLGERPQELHRAAPAVRAHVGDVHRRRRVLQDDDVGAGLARRARSRACGLASATMHSAAATSTASQNVEIAGDS